MRAHAVFEPHVLHACCSSFTLIKRVSVCERTILLLLWSVIVIKSSHNLIVSDIQPETLKREERGEEKRKHPVGNIPQWLRVSSHSDYSRCDGSFIFILISKHHPLNQIALSTDNTQGTCLQQLWEVGNWGSIFLCHELICNC